MLRNVDVIERDLTSARQYCSRVSELETELKEARAKWTGYHSKTFEPSVKNVIRPNPGQGIEGWTFRGAAQCESEIVKLGTRVFREDWNPLTNSIAHIERLAAWATRNGVQLDIRVGYHNPTDNDGDKKILVDQPLSRVKTDTLALAAVMHKYPLAFGYVQFNPWGPWGEAHSSTESANKAYWVAVLSYAREVFPWWVWILCRRPDILKALFATPLDAVKARFGICNLSFGHGGSDAGTDNAYEFAGKPDLGRAYRGGLVGSPFHFEVMQASWFGSPLDKNRDELHELDKELAWSRATTYNPDGPGRDMFRSAGGFSLMWKLGAQLEIVSIDKLPTRVQPGKAYPVSFQIRNFGYGHMYLPTSPALNLDYGNSPVFCDLDGMDLSEVYPGETRVFETTWKVSLGVPLGKASTHLTIYSAHKIPDTQPNRHRYHWQMANTPFGAGDGGNALGLEVEVVAA